MLKKKAGRIMKKKKSGAVWMILPLYIFTIIFVAGLLLYMVALSFAQPKAGHGVEWIFTLENYKKILDPVYMQTFTGSFKLALTSTLFICLIGYPFGYFMAKFSNKWKKRAMIPSDLAILGKFSDPALWMDDHPSDKGLLNHALKSLGLIDKPLRILYSYPAIVIGMTYVFASVYDPLCIFQCGEAGLSHWSATRDLGAKPFKAFWTVSFKLTLPGLLSGVILTFVPSMGLFSSQTFWAEIRSYLWEV